MNYKKIITDTIFWFLTCIIIIAIVFGYRFSSNFNEYREQIINDYGIKTYVYSPSGVTKIYTSDGVLLADIYNEKREYVSIRQMPQSLKYAFVSIEDKNFYKHKGIDPQGILRAFYTDIKTGQRQGGSTITQQFVKNEFLNSQQTMKRKIDEMIIAVELEKYHSKEDILEMYLNEIPFGYVYGVQSAAHTYFDKNVSDLTLAESAMLAGMVKAPSEYNPITNYDKTIKRMKIVLDEMKKDGIITEKEWEQAYNEKVKVVKKTKKSVVTNYKYPYFTNYVISQLKKEYGDKLYNNGWIVYTTLNSKAQDMAEKAIKENVSKYGKNYRYNNAALVSIENKTGNIIAYVGGYDFETDQNDIASTPRQPGSSIKPFNYSTGFDKNIFDLNTVFKDEPVRFGSYSPHNYSNKYKGNMTVLNAIITSNNVIAVKALNEVGISNMISTLKKAGITSITDSDYNLPLTLGGMTYGISPKEMAGAYTTFPNGGVAETPQYIRAIKDRNNNIIKNYTKKEMTVISKEAADEMNFILYKNITSGTAKRAGTGKVVAGKTGTTTSAKSVWFVGYSSDITTAVWIGNSDNSPLRDNATGGGLAAPIFANYMKQACSYYPTINFIKNFTIKPVSTHIGQDTLNVKTTTTEVNNIIDSDIKENKPADTENTTEPTQTDTQQNTGGTDNSSETDNTMDNSTEQGQ